MLKAFIRARYGCGIYARLATFKINPSANDAAFLKCIKPCHSQISSISSSSSLGQKGYVETENRFAHEIMEQSRVYFESLAPSRTTDSVFVGEDKFTSIVTKDWSDESAATVYTDFKTLTNYTSSNKREITEAVFDGICQAIVAKQSEFEDNELAGLLHCLAKWPQTEGLNSRNFSEVWGAIDRQCVARFKNWDNVTLLYFADHWYQLHLLRATKFMWHCIRKLTQKPKNLEPPHLVQLMFYVNACRKLNPAISIFEIEYRIESCLDKFTLDELAIVAMGFFKSQTRIRNPNICAQMIVRATKAADTISDITLCALVKAIRFSVPLTHDHMLTALLDKLLPNVPRLSLLSCVHLALTGTNSQMFHEGILKAVSQRLATEIENVRIKDIERIAFVLTMFNYNPKTTPCIFESIVKELKSPARVEEIGKYPKSLVSCLHYLTLKDVFVDELISKVLHQNFITATYGSHHTKVARDILCLDVNVELERPSYRGNRLSKKTRVGLGKNYTHVIPAVRDSKKLSASDTLTVEIRDELHSLLGGTEFTFVGTVLPNSQRPDIVCSALKADGKFTPIPEEFRSLEDGVVRGPPSTEGQWRCLVVGGWNCYVRDTARTVGAVAIKLRQLKKLGYAPILVPWFEWIKITDADKGDYLKRKLLKGR